MKTSTLIVLLIAGAGLLFVVWKLAKPKGSAGIFDQAGGLVNSAVGMVGSVGSKAVGTVGSLGHQAGNVTTDLVTQPLDLVKAGYEKLKFW